MAQRNLFAHLQIILSMAVLLLIFVVKPVTVLGTPHAAQLKTQPAPSKGISVFVLQLLKRTKATKI